MKQKETGVSELTRRLLIGVPAAILFVLLVWTGGYLLTVAVAITALIIMVEMFGLFKAIELPAYPVVSLLIALYICLITELPGWLTATIAVLLTGLTLLFVLSENIKLSGRWLATLYCGTYAPLGWYLFLLIRDVDPQPAGFWLAITLIAVIWCNDTFAYLGGRSFGKHALAPSISPKKTWEGFLFGFAGSIAAVYVISVSVSTLPLSFVYLLPVAVIGSLFGPVGDLLASKIKRTAGVKDSSTLLPGHGGFFDRFDAFLLCVPVVYLYLNWIL